MSLSVGSSFSANTAHHNLQQTNAKLSLTLAKLSAGRRVTSAGDDAASLAIGSRLGVEVRGLAQAQANAGQASSMLQVADGGMANINDILTRMKTLTVQAGSGQLSTTDRSAINDEFQSLASEVGRISSDTAFGSTNLLDGSAGALSIKVGTGSSPGSDTISVSPVDSSNAGLSINGLDISSQGGADAANTAISAAIDSVQTMRAGIGSSQNRLDYASRNIATSMENTEAARSNLIDLDVARAMSDLAGQQPRMQAGLAMHAQANSNRSSILKLLA